MATSRGKSITKEEAAKLSQSSLVGSKKLIEDIKTVTIKVRKGNKKAKKRNQK